MINQTQLRKIQKNTTNIQAKLKVNLLKNYKNVKHKYMFFTVVDSSSSDVPPDGDEICH